MTGPHPEPGDLVLYQLDESDVPKINAWRANFRAFNASYAGHKHPHRPGQPGATGHVAHTGQDAVPGDVLPAMVITVPAAPRVNLKVFLDGNDFYWATSVPPGEGPGQWRRPGGRAARDEVTVT